MKISLEQIKKLRQKTGSGVMDCRRALEVTGGDLGKARKWLKQQKRVIAAKKMARLTKEGRIEAYIHMTGKIGAMVELLSETDFVAKNPEFKNLAKELAMQVAAMDPKDVAELLKQEYIRDTLQTVEDLLNQAIAKFGENIVVKRFARFEL